jgi:hypothetical protein
VPSDRMLAEQCVCGRPGAAIRFGLLLSSLWTPNRFSG